MRRHLLIDLMRGVIGDCLDKRRFNLVDDLPEKGIVLVGCGATTKDLAKTVSGALDCPVRVADNPQTAVIEGVGRILPKLGFLSSALGARP